MRDRALVVALLLALLPACSGGGGGGGESDADTDADGGGSGDADHDRDGDRDADADREAEGVWVTVPAGTYVMGSPEGELGRAAGETRHEVTLTHRFVILSTEVTQAQFEGLMGYNPSESQGCGPECPVENVSWHDAAAYCNALSDAAGLNRCYDCTPGTTPFTCTPAGGFDSPYACPGYRLPTEAEWEHAARAGTTAATYNGELATTDCPNSTLDPVAWTSCNSGSSRHPVGSLDPNGWGLHDMLGNVWEWCHDWHRADLGADAVTDPWGPASGSARLIRGGSWHHVARRARAAHRLDLAPGNRNNTLGLRPVRSLLGPNP